MVAALSYYGYSLLLIRVVSFEVLWIYFPQLYFVLVFSYLLGKQFIMPEKGR